MGHRMSEWAHKPLMLGLSTSIFHKVVHWARYCIHYSPMTVYQFTTWTLLLNSQMTLPSSVLSQTTVRPGQVLWRKQSGQECKTRSRKSQTSGTQTGTPYPLYKQCGGGKSDWILFFGSLCDWEHSNSMVSSTIALWKALQYGLRAALLLTGENCSEQVVKTVQHITGVKLLDQEEIYTWLLLKGSHQHHQGNIPSWTLPVCPLAIEKMLQFHPHIHHNTKVHLLPQSWSICSPCCTKPPTTHPAHKNKGCSM